MISIKTQNKPTIKKTGPERKQPSTVIAIGIVLGRVAGKAVGITGGAYLAVRLGAAVLPLGVRWNHIFAAAVTAGIGLAVSLFVAEAAFTDPTLLAEAKVGILVGSGIAATAGWFLMKRAGRARVGL